ncbi:penicillin acylase family protein [Sphingomonas lutea]|uniref:Penicillin acylase family protein n=1 Tax=Sphingomonas lutea TaxID=1045317 RepID=A0A7G9SJP5_9SPHN|nr:penicillin acylase family protein [Sphingomonas lutea]QNN68070.1 penicillin acylase family protein [Sphingomonas lutea]
MRALILPLLWLVTTAAAPGTISQWREQAGRVTITRDDWGIAHVHGPTDADAVFGMIYAQAEDDFIRIEDNYLTALGRKAEAEGEKAIWSDLRARLFVSEDELKAQYAQSPERMRRLMDAWAAGLNYFLATHPNVRPRVLKRFEPWMVLSFTEGSIGANIESISLRDLEAFYGARKVAAAAVPLPEPHGSNGIAIAPALTQGRKALLLINPHTSFFFRTEQRVRSDEGLNVYGAATWGQFFIYQGFNDRVGWMHTTSGVDNVDEFAETIEHTGQGRCYRYGNACRPLTERRITLRYKMDNGRPGTRTFTTWSTHHGPIVKAAADGRWIAFAMMHRPVEALQQSYLRTRATDFESFMTVAQLKANSSNNTLYADAQGRIAYLHPQFVPRRDNRFDYTKPVDGSVPATDWGSLHTISELPNVINPPNGWVQNTNNWPYRAAGEFSANPVRFPRYMDQYGENFRGLRAVQLLTGSRGWTLDRLQAAAFDSRQPGFAALVPALVKAFDDLPKADPQRARLAEPIADLRRWDYRWGAESTAQTLAMAWVSALIRLQPPAPGEPTNIGTMRLNQRTTAAQKLQALDNAMKTLEQDFGRWRMPWAEVNRLQRLPSNGSANYDDNAPSIAVPFSSSLWGSLPAFASRQMPGTKRWYGERGNSFVAVVEFGPRVRARAIHAGGASGDPASPHFEDQSARFAAGALRPVYFYPDELAAHTRRTYRPGE